MEAKRKTTSLQGSARSLAVASLAMSGLPWAAATEGHAWARARSARRGESCAWISMAKE